ncbi:MAG: hypothetical protein Q9191_008180, partial [Dirinaria sp. TL-2023a]
KPNSPGLTLDLPSNNPFRNRAASPASLHSLPSPQSLNFTIQTPPERPRSRNPFLDSEQLDIFAPQPRPASPQTMSGGTMPAKGGLYGNTAELFNNLALEDQSTSSGPNQALPYTNRPPRSENVPPPQKKLGPSMHQQNKSREEVQQRSRTLAKPRNAPQTADVFADPPTARPRPRRNSESSLADKNGKAANSDDERKRRERRPRDREARPRDREARHKDGKSGAPGSKKPSRKLDVIDQLDLTGIYGTGMVHHDGPFDACNPHRNRKGSQRAPMQAFAKDSMNNRLDGAGPINKNIDLERFHGLGDEGFTDFSTSAASNPLVESVSFEPYAGASAPTRHDRDVRPGVDRTSSFNPTDRVEPVHGDESLGLGTSTFLEGAPAARAAIQRREVESDNTNGGNSGGLGRKKSLVQKIRGINRSDRVGTGPRSPEAAYERAPTSPTSPTGQAMSAGGMPQIRQANTNPFFNKYEEAYERKGTKIQLAEERNRDDAGPSRKAGPPVSFQRRGGPPPAMLERRVTHDGLRGEEAKPSGGGFLSRVRSLKGGPRRGRPDRG